MRALATLIAVAGLGLMAAGCGESNPSAPSGIEAAKRLRLDGSGPTPLRFVSWAPPLESYDTVFMVVQGKPSSDTLYFRATDHFPRMPYMILDVPPGAQFVDASGNPVPRGTVVPLTVQADSQTIEIHFGPHGSTFTKKPAVIRINWLYTDLLGRLGSDLKLWYQPDTNSAWTMLDTSVDLEFFWLSGNIDHFSNYAVAY